MEYSTPIDDNERRELIGLREENRLLKLEIEKLPKEVNLESPAVHEEGTQDQSPKPRHTAEMIHLEKEIEELKKLVRDHRLVLGGKCWGFGAKRVDSDYGEEWDTSEYWWTLIASNPVNESFCLYDMGFNLLPNSCPACSKHVKGINSLFNQWKALLR